MINLSDSLPTAINGGNNVHWQEDASGNVSAYLSKRKGTYAPVAGVLTIDASLYDSFLITVNAAITSMTINNPTDGQEITLLWVQDSTGHAVTVASNLLVGTVSITTTANKHTCQSFTYDAGTAIWYGIGQNNL